MTPERLLRRLYDAGFRLDVDEGDIVVRPAQLVTPTLRRRIRVQKYELLTVLSEESADPAEPPCVDCGQTLPLSGVRCPDCRDELDDPACASCGVEVEGADGSICELCAIEAQAPLDAETREEA